MRQRQGIILVMLKYAELEHIQEKKKEQDLNAHTRSRGIC